MPRSSYVYPLGSVWDYRKFLFFARHVDDLVGAPQGIRVHGGAILGQDLRLQPTADSAEAVAAAGQPVLLVSADAPAFEDLLASFGLRGLFVEVDALDDRQLVPGRPVDEFPFQNAARLSPPALEAHLVRMDPLAASFARGESSPHTNAPAVGLGLTEAALIYDPRGNDIATPWGVVSMDTLAEQEEILVRAADGLAHPYERCMLLGLAGMLVAMKGNWSVDGAEED